MSTDRPAPRRRLSAAERRDRILAAAQEVFAQRGYHGSSLDDIAKASGTSKALIYEHFDSKRALHESLITEHAGELARRFAQRRDGRDGGGAAARRRRRVLRVGAGAREAWRALFRDAADPELAPLIDRLQAQATRAIVALVPAGGDGVSEQDVEMYAQLTSGACQALANWWSEHPDVPREELVDRVIAFCWDGMSRLPTA